MKPTNWDEMSQEDKGEYARGLLGTMRGVYIMSQALAIAIEAMKAVPAPYTEVSNIQDMEVLKETIFTFPIFGVGESCVK